MKSSGDFIESFIGRRATTCLGWACLFLVLAMLAALILPRVLGNKDAEKAPIKSAP